MRQSRTLPAMDRGRAAHSSHVVGLLLSVLSLTLLFALSRPMYGSQPLPSPPPSISPGGPSTQAVSTEPPSSIPSPLHYSMPAGGAATPAAPPRRPPVTPVSNRATLDAQPAPLPVATPTRAPTPVPSLSPSAWATSSPSPVDGLLSAARRLLPSSAPGVEPTSVPSTAPNPPAVAAPTAAARSVPFRILDSGTSSRPPSWSARPLDEPLVIREAWSYRSFWYGTHPRRRGPFDDGADKIAPPAIDLSRQAVLVLRGRPGTGEIRLMAIEQRPYEIVATFSNPYWPELSIADDRVPFVAVAIDATALPVHATESPLSESVSHLAANLPSLYMRAGGSPRDLNLMTLDRVRDELKAQGKVLLDEVWRIQGQAAVNGAITPYTRLLEARVWEDLMMDYTRAAACYSEVVQRYHGTPYGQVARSHVDGIRRRAMEQAARHRLDEMRGELARDRTRAPGYGRRWLELGGQYEYLVSQRPKALYLAAECYKEGARDVSDSDNVQNCLLRAADIYGTYLNRRIALRVYGECVRRYPDALSVPVVLLRMHGIYRSLGDVGSAWYLYEDFVRRFPRSPRVPEVRRLQGR